MKSKLTKRILAVVITAVALSVLLALSSLAAITGGYGSIDGLEDGKNYEAAEVTLNSTGDGTAIGTPFALDAATNKNLAGLYVVRETGTTDWSDTIYVYGKIADRKDIMEYSGNRINHAKDGTDKFVIGTFSSSQLHYNDYTTLGTLAENHFTTVDTKALYTAMKSGNTTTINEKFAVIKAAADKVYYRYALTTEEIIPIADVEQYTFAMKRNNGHMIIKNNTVRFDAYVMTLDGAVKSYSYLFKNKTYNGTELTYPVDFTTNEGWETPLPDDGYFVGFTIHPYAGVETIDNIAFDEEPSYQTRAQIRYIKNSYSIKIPAKENPTGITVEGTIFNGLDKNVTYSIAPYTIAGADTTQRKTFTGVEEYDLKESFADPAGIYGIAVAGSEYYNDSSAVLVYVYGKHAARSQLGNWAPNGSGKLMPTAVQGTEWIPGTWVSAAGSFATDVWGSTANYYPLTANYIASVQNTRELYALEHTWEEAQEKLYLTNSHGYSSLKTYYDKHYEAGSVSGTYGALKASSAGRAAEIRETVANGYKLRGFKYAFEPGEIISVNELLEFPMYLRSQQYCVYPGTAYAQAIFYVMDEFGNVTSHTWTSEKLITGYQKVLLDTIIDVQAIEGLPEEGWIVGVEIKPYGVVDVDSVTTFIASGGFYDSQMYYSFYFNKYVIDTVKGEKPDVTVEGAVFKGLDKNVKYVVAPYTILGADANNMHEVSGATEFDLTSVIPNPSGLYALVIPGNEYFSDSDPALMYIQGDSADRKELGTFEAGEEKPKAANTMTWEAGVFRGVHNSVHIASEAKGYTFLDDWTAEASVSPADLIAALATDDPEDDLTAQTVIAKKLANKGYRYAYNAEEVTPVTEIYSITVGSFAYNGSNSPLGLESSPKLTVYVMDANGNVSGYTWIGNKIKSQHQGWNETNLQKVDIQSIEGFPTEGWVVGMDYRPFGVVDPKDIYLIDKTTGSNFTTAFYFGKGEHYEIKEDAPTPTLSSFPVIPGGYGEISGLNELYAYEYQLYDVDTDTWSGWAPIPAGVTAFRVTKAGTYNIRAAGTDKMHPSKPAEIKVLEYNSGYEGFDSQIVTMHLPSDFVELTAEYEMDVTVKNWVSTLALDNIKTVAPKSTITIAGEDYKFVVVAEKINLDDTKAHYIDMTVSFNGESRFDRDYEAMKALAGEKYVTEVYFESTSALPFEEAEFWVFVGDDQSGNDVQLRSYNKRINKLRNVETATVIDGWVTFTNYAMTYVIIEK